MKKCVQCGTAETRTAMCDVCFYSESRRNVVDLGAICRALTRMTELQARTARERDEARASRDALLAELKGRAS